MRIYQRDLEAVLESLALATNRVLTLAELPVEQLLRESIIRHASNMTCPSRSDLGLAHEGNDAGHVGFLQNFSVGDFVLPPEVGECPEASEVEVVQLLFVTSVSSPGLAAEQESGEDYSSLNFELDGKVNSSPLINCLPEPPKRLVGFGNSVADHDIYVSRK